MMTKERSTKIKFHEPRSWSAYARGHISHYNDYALSSTQSIYSTLIAIVLSGYNLLPYDIVYFYLFYDGAFDMSPSDKKPM